MLKISRLTDYGLLGAVYLARKRGEVTSAREIAEFYSLPQPMISKVLKVLHEGGVLESKRGAGGGYCFEGNPEEVTLRDLLAVLEGPWDLVECNTFDDEGDAVCTIRTNCPSKTFMSGINRAIKNAFNGITLGDLARGVDPAAWVMTGEKIVHSVRKEEGMTQ
ncbi:MAG: Rrf2 family transcriptional regulator [Thermoanaerobaculia bacterium]|nr:Rrf2 family transcriptional regulator [Thermoanaerobaculia bacterium]